jgi:hypothetical protein
MGRHLQESSNAIALEEVRAHVKQRAWKHYVISTAIVSGAVLGVGQGSKLISEAQNHSPNAPHHAPDAGKITLATLWLTLTTLGGIAGAGIMLPKLNKDQRQIDRIDRRLSTGQTHIRILNDKPIYQKDADGRYETFGAGHKRTMGKMRMEFTGASALAVTGTVLILDSVFPDQLALTKTILPLVRDNITSAKALAAVTEVCTGVVSLGGAIRLAVLGHRDSKLRDIMADDILHHGENTRLVKKPRTVNVVKTGVEPT